MYCFRNHRGLRHYWGLRVRGQHTKTTGRRGRTVGVSKKRQSYVCCMYMLSLTKAQLEQHHTATQEECCIESQRIQLGMFCDGMFCHLKDEINHIIILLITAVSLSSFAILALVFLLYLNFQQQIYQLLSRCYMYVVSSLNQRIGKISLIGIYHG